MSEARPPSPAPAPAAADAERAAPAPPAQRPGPSHATPAFPGAVRVRIEVDERSQNVRAHNVAHTVDVQRVPRNTPVDEARAPWNEGDTLVVPVYEERLVLERRLVLKEEIHIVRQTVRQPVERRMPVRSERAVVERQQADGRWQADEEPAPAEHDNPSKERTQP